MILAFTGAGISVASGIGTFEDNPSMRDQLTRNYANHYPAKYREMMRDWVMNIKDKEPNDAHFALAEYNIPVITMNIDGLHQKAKNLIGSNQIILPLHGRLPEVEELDYCDFLSETPILYGDIAPNYSKAFCMVERLLPGDVFLTIGTSNYTAIAPQLRTLAYQQGARVVVINREAESRVRAFLETH